MLSLGAFRNRLFVSRHIQGRLMLRVGLYWVLYHVVLWHGLLVYHYAQSRISGATATPPPLTENPLWHAALDYLPVLLCGLLTLPVVLIDMLHLSHRIAGPLVQFRSALLELMAGRRVDRVILRKRDLLTEFQDDFNLYLASLNHRPVRPAPEPADPPAPDQGEVPSGDPPAGPAFPVLPLLNLRGSDAPLPTMAGPYPTVWSN